MVRGAAHVFVSDLSACVLCERDAGHLFGSLRLRPGEVVIAGDGNGKWRRCLVGGQRRDPELVVDGPIVEETRPAPLLTVGFALTKGGGPERVVQKLTELGVDRLLPLTSARSVVRWGPDRAPEHLERLRRVAREAAMQSRRVYLPEVAPLAGLSEAVELWPRDQLALAHPGGQPVTLGRPTVLVGPEGGWDVEELRIGLASVDLGPTRLRAETAAMAAGVLLVALRAGGVRPAAASPTSPSAFSRRPTLTDGDGGNLQAIGAEMLPASRRRGSV